MRIRPEIQDSARLGFITVSVSLPVCSTLRTIFTALDIMFRGAESHFSFPEYAFLQGCTILGFLQPSGASVAKFMSWIGTQG